MRRPEARTSSIDPPEPRRSARPAPRPRSSFLRPGLTGRGIGPLVVRTHEMRGTQRPSGLPTIHVVETRRSHGDGSTGLWRRARRVVGIAFAMLLAGFAVVDANELVDFVARADPSIRWLKRSEREIGSV